MSTRNPLVRGVIATTAATSLVVLSVITSSANASPRFGLGAPAADSLERAASSAAVQKDAPKNGVYIVRMTGMPVVAYEGGIRGLAATEPAEGEKIEPNSAAVAKYADYLKTRQDAAVAKVGGSTLYNYVYAFNGFSAKLTSKQISELLKDKDVVSVTPDALRQLDTSSTPDFLGLTGAEGVWNTQGEGEGVVIGIVDTGITPDAASFADPAPDGFDFPYPSGDWKGSCQPGEGFTFADCSDKIVGARYYNEGWGGNSEIDAHFPWDYNSPLDYDGHGTHTASTAGGNAGVTIPGTEPASVYGTINGIAPRAHIAAYKVCWGGDAGGCQDSDSIAAIDQAVADGVDVINFSISGSLTSFLDPVEVAFLFAADAGVFVAASAGNNGPTTSTVAHPGPWLTTVAAGTHDRESDGSVELGNEATYDGASSAIAPVTAPLINATAAGVAGADATALRLCYTAAENGGTAVLDPGLVTGKIVVCDRGGNARVSKSEAVKAAGGVGMILVNTSTNSLNADFHSVPTVHLQDTDRPAVTAYAATAGATATIVAATVTYTADAPFTASFSSRGPLLAGQGDLIKPDLIAPGQDILAAVAPPGNSGRSFDLYSGTSMSSPHVAGLAALVRGVNPAWSPMAIKSALMTTGYDVHDSAITEAQRIFRQGAGHVEPASAFAPGLVFDSGWDDWLEFLCATELDCEGSGVPVTDPSDLNTPSIAIGTLAGSQTVTRRVKNVSGSDVTYDTHTVTGLTGFDVSFTPDTITLAAGASTDVTITITRTSAAVNTYAGGQITWTGPGSEPPVRIPVVVKPVTLAAPVEVSESYDVQFGYTGEFTATARGLVPAVLTDGTVADDPSNGACTLSSPNAVTLPVTVPAGTTFARFGILDEDVTPGADLDLCVFDETDARVGESLSGGSTETVDLVDPPAGAYRVVVQGWAVPATPSPFVLNSWLLSGQDEHNMTLTAPASATLGAAATIELAFSDLLPETRYLGSVAYSGVADLPDPTIVRVDTPADLPTPDPTPTVTVTATPDPAPTVTVTATPAPAPTVTVTPTPTVTPVSCSVKAVSGASRLKVNMGPNLPGSGYYVFRVDKRVSGQWVRVLKEMRTQGAGETRTVNVPKGTYRVKCYGQGFPKVTGSLAGDTTSKSVKIKR